MAVAGFEVDVVAHAASGGDSEEADRPAAHDDDPFARSDARAADAVPGDTSGLDEARVGEVEAIGQRDEATLGHAGAIGETTVDEDAEIDVVAGAAVGVPGAAFGARAAVRVGFHGIGHAVDVAGELVAERERLRSHGHEAEVGAADARRHDFHELAFAGRFVHLDHGRTVFRAADPPHREAVCQP